MLHQESWLLPLVVVVYMQVVLVRAGNTLRGSMQPVSRHSLLNFDIVACPAFHLIAAFRSLKPLSQSSNIRLRISMAIGLIRDILGGNYRQIITGQWNMLYTYSFTIVE